MTEQSTPSFRARDLAVLVERARMTFDPGDKRWSEWHRVAATLTAT